MEKGILVKWEKRDGEYVEEGEILFVVEADKATQDIEALESGYLHIPPGAPPPGSELPVGTLLGYLLQAGEDIPVQASQADRPAPAAGPAPVSGARKTASPGIAEKPASGTPNISPRARRVAAELNVDWTFLKGSGRTGRIVERDVRRAGAQKGQDVYPTTPPLSAPVAPTGFSGMTDAVSPVRRLIAERMAASAHTAAAVTLTTEADATELVRVRRQFKADPSQPAPTYNDLLAKLVALALAEHPAVNARLEDGAILQSTTVNVGIAVDTERGLLVPVLRNVQAKPLVQIVHESAVLIEAARTGRIDPNDLNGGTFTITNLGMYEIDAFTPIINLPECAILGVGRIVPKQVVVDAEAEKTAIRHMMFLSLTFDHRLVDGAPAARFLQRVKQFIEQPYLSLMYSIPA